MCGCTYIWDGCMDVSVCMYVSGRRIRGQSKTEFCYSSSVVLLKEEGDEEGRILEGFSFFALLFSV